jgi:hypothetical protein
LLRGLVGLDGLIGCKASLGFRAVLLELASRAMVGRLARCFPSFEISFDLDLFSLADLSRPLVVAALPGIGNGGKAQSRFVSSGEGGRRGPGSEPLRVEGNGDLGPEPALMGDAIELCPLLAGVSSSCTKGRSRKRVSSVAFIEGFSFAHSRQMNLSWAEEAVELAGSASCLRNLCAEEAVAWLRNVSVQLRRFQCAILESHLMQAWVRTDAQPGLTFRHHARSLSI